MHILAYVYLYYLNSFQPACTIFFFFTVSTFFIVIKYNNIKFTILALFKAPVQ